MQLVRKFFWLALLLACAPLHAEVNEIRIAKGAGGLGFLPLMVMEKYQLIEKNAKAAGLPALKARYLGIGGPSVVNDALLSGAVDIAPAGPPAFLLMWARTQNSSKVKGVAAMTSIPMYLNTTSPAVKSLDDVSGKDKIAVTSIKVSIPSIAMQMYAMGKYGKNEFARFDKYTVSMTHPDAMIAMLSGRSEVDLHFTSPPFHQREQKDPRIRTIVNSNQLFGGPNTFTMLYTTTKFHDNNPKTYAVMLKALEESIAFIKSHAPEAAQLYLDSDEGKGWKRDEIVRVLQDPDINFTTAPQAMLKYLNFMNAVGTLKSNTANWKDLFFPEIHNISGN